MPQLVREAESLSPTLENDLARQFAAAVRELPPIPPRVIYYDEQERHYYAPRAIESLDPTTRERLVEKAIDQERYYYTKYGTPLAYARALDLAARHGFPSAEKKRILDFGYGTIGHLRLLATLGADTVGVDVDTFLEALYGRPDDQGDVRGRNGKLGHLKLVSGHWPTDANVKQAVGQGFDLFLSKNTLKNGYIHPERDVDPRRLVHLGVDDETFVRAVFDLLNPGGVALIYNISPAPAPPDKPYIPWADGRCPFARNLWESVGFRVIAFDADDSQAARAMGRALGWDQGEGAMDLENDLFAHYTIARKPP